jgi:hypothetical protein
MGANLIEQTAYYIAFGAHGPRAQTPPGEGWKVFAYTMIGVGVSLGLFSFIRMFGQTTPSTMNKEYQEATNEYLRVCFSPYIWGCFSVVWLGVNLDLGGMGGGWTGFKDEGLAAENLGLKENTG